MTRAMAKVSLLERQVVTVEDGWGLAGEGPEDLGGGPQDPTFGRDPSTFGRDPRTQLMVRALGLEAALLVLLSVVSGLVVLSMIMLTVVLLVLVMTLVRVAVRLVVGGALALPFLRLVSTESRKGRRAGGVSETTARMFGVLGAILLVVGVAWRVGRPLSLVA